MTAAKSFIYSSENKKQNHLRNRFMFPYEFIFLTSKFENGD